MKTIAEMSQTALYLRLRLFYGSLSVALNLIGFILSRVSIGLDYICVLFANIDTVKDTEHFKT
jgi:hypothetical protein